MTDKEIIQAYREVIIAQRQIIEAQDQLIRTFKEELVRFVTVQPPPEVRINK